MYSAFSVGRRLKRKKIIHREKLQEIHDPPSFARRLKNYRTASSRMLIVLSFATVTK
jgi:hypothetical protein